MDHPMDMFIGAAYLDMEAAPLQCFAWNKLQEFESCGYRVSSFGRDKVRTPDNDREVDNNDTRQKGQAIHGTEGGVGN